MAEQNNGGETHGSADELIEIILGYMRGDFGCSQASARLREFHAAGPDKNTNLISHMLIGTFALIYGRTGRDDLAHWESLRRALAALKGNIELEKVTLWMRGGRQFVALAGLIAMITTAFLAVSHGYIPLIIAWVAAGVLLDYPILCVSPDKMLGERHPYIPFRSREQWRKYEPLLRELDVPAFDPQRIMDSRRDRTVGDRLWSMAGFVIFILFTPVVALVGVRGLGSVVPFVKEGTEQAGDTGGLIGH